MKILFLHGWRSVVGGVKPMHLKAAGHDVINPPLDDDDFSAAVMTGQTAYNQHQPDVVVGSSRGGAVAMNISSGVTPLVLLCPAWKNWGTANTVKPQTIILHSPQDEVIPLVDSEELVANSGLPDEVLISVGHDHRLADDESLAVLLWSCQLLAAGENMPTLDSTNPTPTVDANGMTSQEESSYICGVCGEEIIIPLDISEGVSQSYVEDCPVCCRANQIHVRIDIEGGVKVWAESDQEDAPDIL